MPYWSVDEERKLTDMIQSGESLERISSVLNRSEEAIRLKAKRLGLAPPSSVKVTNAAPTLQPITSSELPSPMEALQLLWGAVERLRQPDVSSQEAKKIRLLLSGVKSYIVLEADYLFRTKEVERRMLTMYKTELTHLEHLANTTADPSERAKLQAQIKVLKREIADMEAAGVKETKTKPLSPTF